MTRTSPLGICVACVLLVLLSSVPCQAGDVPSPEVVSAARAGLTKFIAAVPPGEAAMWGLGECRDLAVAELGDPLRRHNLSVEKVLSYSPGMDPLSVLSPTDEWLFPVHCGGSAGAFLTVAKTGNGWEAVDFGGAVYASQLLAVLRQWPGSQGYSYRLVRDPALKVALVIVLQGAAGANALGVVPFDAMAQRQNPPLGIPWQPKLYPVDDVLGSVQGGLLDQRAMGGDRDVH